MKWMIVKSSELGDNWLPSAHMPEVWLDRLEEKKKSYLQAIAKKQEKVAAIDLEIRRVVQRIERRAGR